MQYNALHRDDALFNLHRMSFVYFCLKVNQYVTHQMRERGQTPAYLRPILHKLLYL